VVLKPSIVTRMFQETELTATLEAAGLRCPLPEAFFST